MDRKPGFLPGFDSTVDRMRGAESGGKKLLCIRDSACPAAAIEDNRLVLVVGKILAVECAERHEARADDVLARKF